MRAMSANGKLCRCPSSKTTVTLRRDLELELELEAEFCAKLVVAIISASIPQKIDLTVLSMLPPRNNGVTKNQTTPCLQHQHTNRKARRFHSQLGRGIPQRG